MIYKVHIIYDVPRWAYWRRAVALQKYAPDDFEVTIGAWDDFKGDEFADTVQRCDLIYNCAYSTGALAQQMISRYRRKNMTECWQVVSYNSDQFRNPGRWRPLVHAADFVIANNQLIFDNFRRPKGTCNISNGVDHENFCSVRPIVERENRAIWCGSTSPRKTKCYDTTIIPLEKMSKRGEVRWETDFRGIDEIDSRVWETKIQNRWYNDSKVVLCAASGEGTPNYLIEGAMAGCVPVATACGNTPEWLKGGENGIAIPKFDVAGAAEGINRAIENCAELHRNILRDMVPWRYSHRAPYFFALFRKIINESPNAVAPFTWSEISPEQI